MQNKVIETALKMLQRVARQTETRSRRKDDNHFYVLTTMPLNVVKKPITSHNTVLTFWQIAVQY